MPRKQYWSNGCITGWPVGGGRWLWGLLRHWGWPGPNPRTSFITGLTKGAVIRVPLSRLVWRALRLFPPLRLSPFLCLFFSSWFRLFALTLPLSVASLSAYLSATAYSLPTLAPTIDASRLIANPPSICLSLPDPCGQWNLCRRY